MGGVSTRQRLMSAPDEEEDMSSEVSATDKPKDVEGKKDEIKVADSAGQEAQGAEESQEELAEESEKAKDKQNPENSGSDIVIHIDRDGEDDTPGGKSTETNVDGQPESGEQQKKRSKKSRKKKEKNALTKLIPGYTAPMQLSTSSLDKYRPSGGMKDLQKKAQATDASTQGFVVGATKQHSDAMQKGTNGLLSTSYTEAYSSFKKGTKRPHDETAGKGWFNMVPTKMTDEIKMDLAVIRNRNYLDPKKFYKSSDRHSDVLQLGTVIEGAAEYYSSRLTKKQRRTNITDEIMADPSSSDYAKNKFREMAREKTRQASKRSRKPKKGKRFHS